MISEGPAARGGGETAVRCSGFGGVMEAGARLALPSALAVVPLGDLTPLLQAGRLVAFLPHPFQTSLSRPRSHSQKPQFP